MNIAQINRNRKTRTRSCSRVGQRESIVTDRGIGNKGNIKSIASADERRGFDAATESANDWCVASITISDLNIIVQTLGVVFHAKANELNIDPLASRESYQPRAQL